MHWLATADKDLTEFVFPLPTGTHHSLSGHVGHDFEG